MGLTCILACLKPIQIIVNIKKIASNLLKKNQELIEVKYFTSRISNDPDKQKRQSIYIEALESVGIKVFYGNYQRNTTECRQCGNIWPTFHEKMTDVNIATQMMIDAFQDRYDMAMLISGDSDLVPPIIIYYPAYRLQIKK